jgi:hypothetical protein
VIINKIDAGFSNYLVPAFTYTGNYTVVDDGAAGWRIKFLSSGTLVLNQYRTIDVFCVGGGASGTYGYTTFSDSSGKIYSGGNGGGGGYTKTSKRITAVAGKSYTITVGAGGSAAGGGTSAAQGKAGGSSSAFGITAAGGVPYKSTDPSGYSYYYPGNGGSGGGEGADEEISAVKVGSKGGTDGGNGYYWDYDSNSSKIAKDTYNFGQGQHTTTREFGEAGATLYSGGGGGGGYRAHSRTIAPGAGGAGGGGKGAAYNAAAVAGTANTGGGGGGGYFSSTSSYRRASGAGGSGIVIIRNAR